MLLLADRATSHFNALASLTVSHSQCRVTGRQLSPRSRIIIYYYISTFRVHFKFRLPLRSLSMVEVYSMPWRVYSVTSVHSVVVVCNLK